MPGEKVPSKEKQLRWLVEKLTGHEPFHRLRGGLQHPVINRLVGNVQKGGSRRAGQERFRQFTDNLVLIQSIIAQFERDGWDYALEQLKFTLTIPGYLFPGEVIPIDQTTEMLLIIPNFKRAIGVMRWVKENGGYEEAKAITEEVYCLLFDLLPSLESIFQERVRQHGKTITQYKVSLEMAADRDLDLPKRPNIHKNECGFVSPRNNVHFGIFYYGWLIALKWQKDFLRQVPRQEQKMLTTWHFRIPTASLENKFNHLAETIRVGFHPAEEHKKWQKLYPAFASQETKEGLGVICWPHEKNLEGYPEGNLLCGCH